MTSIDQRMRYFSDEVRSGRYEQFRPRVHGRFLAEAARARGRGKVARGLDVCCGTGHSTTALRTWAQRVFGCDVSLPMLAEAAPELRGSLVCCAAEQLPFGNRTMDLISVSMGFHWLDQTSFLLDARRILRTGGELWVYNFWFPGELRGNHAFGEWVRDRYLRRFPSPHRSAPAPDEVLAAASGFDHVQSWAAEYWVDFTRTELRSYFTTQSNVQVVLQAGESGDVVDQWLDAELSGFFPTAGSESFAYHGRLEVAVAS